ncbi:MAG: RNA-binding transcriptional accessory protein, partial [Cyclobacteriaceae bacterium]|nr:RNA-binding transcriptional accessory protein [Cyclobacteriaceae bacterium]
MSKSNISIIAKELAIQQNQVNTVINLLDEGATIPFISRYRKEMTGSLDEIAIENISNKITSLREIDKRREAIITSLEKLEKLTPELKKLIDEASSLAELEDIYLPYKPKRKTKASIAKEKGLEPLATSIYNQSNINIYKEAAAYINSEKEVANEEEALQGARDIIAEWINENKQVRELARELFLNEGVLSSKVLKNKEEEGQKYKDYFDWEEPIKKTPSHRLLAMRRGEKEMILSLDIKPDTERALQLIENKVVVASNESADQVKIAVLDCYKRLLKPSMETEIRLLSKTKADKEAIDVFSDNLRKLLLAAPLGQKNVLAIDPGFRT